MKVLVKAILWCGKPAVLACDGRCSKAFGCNSRPTVQLSDDPDDFAFKADHELAGAPRDPGTYEGECGKPTDYADPNRQNKWCARECERKQLVRPGEVLSLPDFTRPVRNKPTEADA